MSDSTTTSRKEQANTYLRYQIRIRRDMPDRTRCPHCGRKMVIDEREFMLCINDSCWYLLNKGMNALIDTLCQLNSQQRITGEQFEAILELASEAVVEAVEASWEPRELDLSSIDGEEACSYGDRD
jgi:hypothetical protein